MNKILLIASREYLIRVRKRTFLIATILTPLFFVAVMILPIWLTKNFESEKKIAVIDANNILTNKLKNQAKLTFFYPQDELSNIKSTLLKKGYYALIYIPKLDLNNAEITGIKIFSEKSISIEIELDLKKILEQALEDIKLAQQGIDKQTLEKIKTNVKISTETLKGEDSSSVIAYIIALLGAFIIYMAVFLYGSQVLQGVIEEKSNRIIEVIISSVKPFELMMGKILGIGAIGLTQFLLWIVLTFGITTAVFSVMKVDNNQIAPQQIAKDMSQEQKEALEKTTQNAGTKVITALLNMNIPLILGAFLFYFLLGYLLYSALFAAVGSAIDNITDAQQFTLPITMPMIVAVVVVQPILKEPDGLMALIFSLFPLTSPVVMMARIPFGVPAIELVASMLLLFGTFLFITWVAARIYRVGVLMYGKKPTYKELFRWIFIKV